MFVNHGSYQDVVLQSALSYKNPKIENFVLLVKKFELFDAISSQTI